MKDPSSVPITERAAQCKARPHEDLELCGTCTFVLVEANDRRRVWRCEGCLRYIEAPVIRENELNFKDRMRHPRAVPMDQGSLF